jgi:N-acyl amino acid synthase of PEP-CTERM/exosortase system
LVSRDRQSTNKIVTSQEATAFHRSFNVIPAYNEALIRQAKRVRYQVYCLENHYCKKVGNALMDEDEYDSHSLHTLLHSRVTGSFVSTVRLILPFQKAQHKPFPIEKYVNLSESVVRRFFLKRENIAELSRIAIANAFKKRTSEAATLSGVSPVIGVHNYIHDERTGYPLSLALISSAFVVSAGYGISNLLAFLEPPLMRMLENFGMNFIPIGPLTEYYGKQVPTIANVNELLYSVRTTSPGLWKFILDMAVDWKSHRTVNNV